MRNPLAPHRSLSTQDSWPEFIAKHAEEMHGVISGFDRLVFSGSLRAIRYAVEIKAYLIRKRVWLGDFAQHLEAVSEWLKQSSLADAQKLGRTIRYQASSQIDKDAVAGEIAAHEKITSGPVCVSTLRGARRSGDKKLDLLSRLRKCLFLYHYWMHPVFGFMKARIQT